MSDSGRGLPWLVILVAFTVLGLLTALGQAGVQWYEQRPVGLWTVLLASMPSWWCWGLAALPISRLSGRYPLTPGVWRRHLGIHLVAAAVMVGGLAILNATIGRALYADLGQSWTMWFLAYMSRAAAWNLLVYGGLVGLAHAIDARARLRHREIESARLETQLARAQLHSLQLQLQPHFLFNTLHAIGVLNQEAPDRATRMIASLGDLLRASLDTRASQEIPLDRELELLDHYLDIESIRFSDRLSIAVDVMPGLGRHLVPTFLLQPLVENAVRHGVAARAEPSRIRVAAEAVGDELVLSVWNDGPLIDLGRMQEGVGLATTRDRLQRLYGDAGRLSLRNRDGGVECAARLPLHDQPVL